MQIQPTKETKLADWMTAFNSISNKQSQEAQILRGLAIGLKEKIANDGMVIIPGSI